MFGIISLLKSLFKIELKIFILNNSSKISESFNNSIIFHHFSRKNLSSIFPKTFFTSEFISILVIFKIFLSILKNISQSKLEKLKNHIFQEISFIFFQVILEYS